VITAIMAGWLSAARALWGRGNDEAVPHLADAFDMTGEDVPVGEPALRVPA
jgi:hypothetical protein